MTPDFTARQDLVIIKGNTIKKVREGESFGIPFPSCEGEQVTISGNRIVKPEIDLSADELLSRLERGTPADIGGGQERTPEQRTPPAREPENP